MYFQTNPTNSSTSSLSLHSFPDPIRLHDSNSLSDQLSIQFVPYFLKNSVQMINLLATRSRSIPNTHQLLPFSINTHQQRTNIPGAQTKGSSSPSPDMITERLFFLPSSSPLTSTSFLNFYVLDILSSKYFSSPIQLLSIRQSGIYDLELRLPFSSTSVATKNFSYRF